MKIFNIIKSKMWLRCILTSIFVILLTFIVQKGYFFIMRNANVSREFSWDRLIMFLLFSMLVGIHFVISPKKIWDFIYKKRYIIGGVLFCVVVLNGYHGSSIYGYNAVIQPNHPVDNAPFMSSIKPIRSDEFLVDTPAVLSQVNHNSDFKAVNNALMARDDLTTYMFPQLPTKTISVLSNPKLLGFLVLPEAQAFSFFWYLMVFIGFFASFELAMLITKGKKLYSVTGASLLTFSPMWLWWGQSNLWISGCCAVLFFHLFLKTSNAWKKLLYSVLFGYAGSIYIMGLYPAWMIPFGYLFLGLLIWQLYEFKDRLRWKEFWYLIPVLIVMGVILIPAFIGSTKTIELMSATVYPAKSVSTGGHGSELLYNYFISPFFTLFKNIPNASESSQTIGLYPIPFFIGLYVCFINFKNKHHDILLNVLLVFGIGLCLYNYFNIPLLNKITMMFMSSPERSQVVVNIFCVLIILRLLSNYECAEWNIKKSIFAVIVAAVVVAFGLSIVYMNNSAYLQVRVIVASVLLYVPIFSLVFVNHEKGNKVLCGILIIVSLFNFATVQPISKGLSVMHEKPFAKEVKKILEKDKNAVWVVTNPSSTGLWSQSYLLSNGARVLNSTNIYPNLDLWHKFDPNGKYDEVYNRYAHVSINLTNEKLKFHLMQQDFFQVSIPATEAYKLGAKYFVSNEDLSVYNTADYNYKRIYDEDGMYIYQFIKS